MHLLSATSIVAAAFSMVLSCGDSGNDNFTGGGQGGSTGGASTGGSTSSGQGGKGGANAAGDGNVAGNGNTAGDGNAAGNGNTAGAGGAINGCGDFVCSARECANGSCPPDCGIVCGNSCGDGSRDYPETCSTCPADWQTGCGDGCCLLGENCQDCPQDCITVEGCDPSACGNNQCNYGLSETCLNCPDCFGLCACGDTICGGPETPANCPWDCP